VSTEHVLYGSAGSGSATIEAALEWADLPYRIVSAASWEPGPGLEALKKVNPLAQIPTLVLPDGTVLTESAAILIHLGLSHPHSGLLPSEAGVRARALRALVFIAANCYAAVGISDYPERWCTEPDEASNARVRAAARTQLHRAWDLFADQFSGEPFLFGAQPNAVDLMAAVISKWSGTRAHLKQSRPRFLATLLRIEAQPRIAAVFARHWKAA
jgi:GST-like protein